MTHIILFIISSIVIIDGLAVTDKPFFREDYIYEQSFENFYKIHNVKKNFSDAIEFCQLEGAELFLPTTSDELMNVINMSDSKVGQMWIGAHDIFSEGEFVTLDGTPLEEVYQNWITGEPSDYQNNEDCVEVVRNGGYNDIPCSRKLNFACKRNTIGLIQNLNCRNTDEKYIYDGNLGSCYKFHDLPRDWNSAFKVCKAEIAKLVIINSENEANLLMREFGKHKEVPTDIYNWKLIHIGVTDVLNHGRYLTIEGIKLSEVGYEKWAEGQPNNNKHCVGMARNGTLNTIDCQTKAMFVCEKKIYRMDLRFLSLKSAKNV